eukprot:scaffold25_cov342-Pavlova_lutheri.AAC.70
MDGVTWGGPLQVPRMGGWARSEPTPLPGRTGSPVVPLVDGHDTSPRWIDEGGGREKASNHTIT